MTKPAKKQSKFIQLMKGTHVSQRFNAVYGPSLSESAMLRGYELQIPNPAGKAEPFKPTIKFPTEGLSATVNDGRQMNDYISKGAVGGGIVVGAVILGPLGALAGGLIGSSKRKGGTQLHVVVERDGETIAVITGPATKENEANLFAKAINDSAADYPNKDS